MPLENNTLKRDTVINSLHVKKIIKATEEHNQYIVGNILAEKLPECLETIWLFTTTKVWMTKLGIVLKISWTWIIWVFMTLRQYRLKTLTKFNNNLIFCNLLTIKRTTIQRNNEFDLKEWYIWLQIFSLYYFHGGGTNFTFLC